MKEAGQMGPLFQNVMGSDFRGNVFIFSSPMAKTINMVGRITEPWIIAPLYGLSLFTHPAVKTMHSLLQCCFCLILPSSKLLMTSLLVPGEWHLNVFSPKKDHNIYLIQCPFPSTKRRNECPERLSEFLQVTQLVNKRSRPRAGFGFRSVLYDSPSLWTMQSLQRVSRLLFSLSGLSSSKLPSFLFLCLI